MATVKNVVIKASKMTCPKAADMLQLAASGKVDIPIVVLKNNIGKFDAYAESVDEQNKIGMVLSADGSIDIEEYFRGDYEMRITGLGDKANLLIAELCTSDTAAAVQTGEESTE